MPDGEVRRAIIDSAEVVNTPQGQFLEINARTNTPEAAAELPQVLEQMGLGKAVEQKPAGKGKSFSMADLGKRYEEIFRREQAPNN